MTESVTNGKSATVGQRIRMARKEARMTTLALALALGVDPRTVARWQSDEAMPSVLRLGEIATVLQKSPGYFLDGDREAA